MPDDADANVFNLKAWSLANINKNEEALTFVEKSLEIEPNNIAAMDTKGFILYNLGKYHESISWYDKALEINPNFEETIKHKDLSIQKLDRTI